MLRFALPVGHRSTLVAAFALGVLAPATPALSPLQDTTLPGFSLEGQRPVGVYDAYATLPNGDRVVFDGVVMNLVAEDGTPIRVLGTTSGFVFPSFVLPDPTSTCALIGESSRGKIYRVDLAGAGASVLADLDNNFDAVFENARHALVSAAPCGFGCGNEIHRLDVNTGALTLVASLAGPSGPIARASNGDLYYGSIPNSPGPGTILRWTQAQVASGAILDESSAAIFASGIDPASSMRFDTVYGHLFVSTPVFGGTSQILEFAPSGTLVAAVIQSPDYLANVELLPTQGIGSFQAFQPEGVRLNYRGTDYFANTSAIRTVRTRRPRAFTSGPGLTGPGAVTFTVRGAHPNASFLVMVGRASSYDPNESTYDLGTYLFHTGMPIGGIRRLTYVATDANGEGSFTFYNPGNLQGTRVLQAMIRDSGGTFVGSSTEAFN
jgi:hypothetical protein